ncbi:MAG: PAS domain-containing protein [Deltaproteobacteria bacterium]|nr:PAS domain-containing protein [Deltaproteobacteria bacterium]
MKDSETEAVTRLEGEKRKLETIIDSIGDPFYIVGSDLKILYENKAGKAAFGKHIGEYCYAAYHNRKEVCEGCPVAGSFKDGKIHTSEITMHTDKGILYLENTASPLKDSTGKITSCVEVVRDITRRKRAEEALRTAEREKAAILDSMVEVVTYRDTNSRILWANKTAYKALGLSREEIVGRKCYEVWHQRSEPCESCPIDNAVRTGQPQEGEVTTPDGRVWFVRGYPVRDSNSDIIGSVETTLEITDRKRVERTLQEKEKGLEYQAQRLEKLNTALQVLLDHREEEKKKLEENMLASVRKLILPYVEKLEKGNLDGDSQTYVSIIKSNLSDFLSHFSNRLSTQYADFTPTEVEVADLIKQGKTSKDIASLLNVSCDTVLFHRKNIRKKLGLLHKKRNLRSHLLSLTS